jgi:hypothetical protein
MTPTPRMTYRQLAKHADELAMMGFQATFQPRGTARRASWTCT